MLAAVRANLYISQTVNCRNDTMFTLCFTGTTWTQEIIWQIYHDGETDSRILSERFPFIEAVVLPHHPHHTTNPKEMLATFASMPSPRLLKTHLPYGLAPKGKDEATKPRYICVMRNPKDAAVSLYHQCNAWEIFAYNKPWDHFFNLFMKNEGRKAAIPPSVMFRMDDVIICSQKTTTLFCRYLKFTRKNFVLYYIYTKNFRKFIYVGQTHA